ncbi:META domain-containing protein [Winogradskyella psychrotolerans]|uniref:META domain-containing protein n=1 Tax=Winogradskyella psychrotolerans TaxID=1344585 RepID=UPI001C07D9A9|nr:META domain-containing protein [Winogradskyella psychrotolerans]MBU2922723.1 META domain-containing protein [Winogradskyella psychrotolerans]
MKILVSLFMLLATLNSCDSSKKAIENSKKMQEPISGTYNITQLGDTDVSSNKIVINFDDTNNKVAGFAGCNSFFGNYSIENNTISFGSIGSSRKLCPNPIMDIENQLLKTLNSVTSFSTQDNEISFYSNNTVVFKGTNSITASKRSATVNYEDNTTVKYQTVARGSFNYITISKTKLLISKDQNLQKIDKFNTDPEDWKALNKLIEAVEVETIHNLVPPSTKHQYDGAPLATLAIILGDVQYMTPAFDHGNPPESVKALVNKVLSIKENTVKN